MKDKGGHLSGRGEDVNHSWRTCVPLPRHTGGSGVAADASALPVDVDVLDLSMMARHYMNVFMMVASVDVDVVAALDDDVVRRAVDYNDIGGV